MPWKSARYYYLQGNYTHGGTSVGSEGLSVELGPALLTMRRGMWARSLEHVTMLPLSLRCLVPLGSPLFSLLHDHLPFSTVQSGLLLPDSDRTTLLRLTMASRASFVTSEPQFPHIVSILTYVVFKAPRKC